MPPGLKRIIPFSPAPTAASNSRTNKAPSRGHLPRAVERRSHPPSPNEPVETLKAAAADPGSYTHCPRHPPRLCSQHRDNAGAVSPTLHSFRSRLPIAQPVRPQSAECRSVASAPHVAAGFASARPQTPEPLECGDKSPLSLHRRSTNDSKLVVCCQNLSTVLPKRRRAAALQAASRPLAPAGGEYSVI